MKRGKRIAAAVLLLVGLAIYLSPDLYSLWFTSSNKQIVSEFQAKYEAVPESRAEESSTEEPLVLDNLFIQAQQYNERIFGENQAGMSDAWIFSQSPFALEFEDDLFGYVEIPAMDVTLPLYLGATNENMAKGAVVLGETSVPIGGKNTNSVIAGHRGYQGSPYFREIEKLKVGDKVLVTNPWETLVYKVTELAVIQPDNSDAIRIQPKKDMVTLVTCHPYRSHGKYRYLAYCERVQLEEEEVTEDAPTKEVQPEEQPVTGDVEFVSSEEDIQGEKTMRMVGALVILILILLLVLPIRRSNNKK